MDSTKEIVFGYRRQESSRVFLGSGWRMSLGIGWGGGGGVLVSHWVGFCAKSGSGDIEVWSRNYTS